VTAQREMTHQEILESCTADCAAARAAIGAASHILAHEDSGQVWTLYAWELKSPEGEIRLTLAGTPCGRVPRDFQIRWYKALMDAAWREIVQLREHG
jgi:hypothetical protein